MVVFSKLHIMIWILDLYLLSTYSIVSRQFLQEKSSDNDVLVFIAIMANSFQDKVKLPTFGI